METTRLCSLQQSPACWKAGRRMPGVAADTELVDEFRIRSALLPGGASFDDLFP